MPRPRLVGALSYPGGRLPGREDEMGLGWGQPKWRDQGRTGPGPGAPRYAKRKDRAAVRKGGQPGQKGGSGCGLIVAVAVAWIALCVWSVFI